MGKLPLYKEKDSVNCYSYTEELDVLDCIIMRVLFEESTGDFYYKLQVQDSFNYPIIYRSETELL